MVATAAATGRIVQVMGPVVDIEFPPDQLPAIYNALEVKMDDETTLVLETQTHLGNDWVRAVAMSTTDGLRRGMNAVDTGHAILVPVGPETLGDRKSTRLNSSHDQISYAVFCLKKKK